MPDMRQIIEIDEERCTGCGQCILDCAEGALQLVNGKAKLVGEIYCDGLGACIGNCPEDALHIVERPAAAFDEEAVEERLAQLKQAEPLQDLQTSLDEAPMACGCPSSMAATLSPKAPAAQAGPAASQLEHWPIKLQLLSPQAPFLKGADLLLLSDCAGTALPDLHGRLLKGRAVALACPKLDDANAHITKLAQLLAGARPASITTVTMEVPCCRGLDFIAQKAMEAAGVELPLGNIMVSRDGKIIQSNDAAGQKAA